MKRLLPIMFLIACDAGTPEVVEAPDYGNGVEPKLVPCNASTVCPPGQICSPDKLICEPGIVIVPDTQTGQPDAGVINNPFPDTAILDNGGQQIPDLPQTDTNKSPPTAADECQKAGSADTCTEKFHSCKMDPLTKALVCVDIEADNPQGSPCGSSATCGEFYGCHFGVCTGYCELLLPVCANGDCIDVGHPIFGICKPK